MKHRWKDFWQGWDKPTPMPLRPSQIRHGLSSDWTQTAMVMSPVTDCTSCRTASLQPDPIALVRFQFIPSPVFPENGDYSASQNSWTDVLWLRQLLTSLSLWRPGFDFTPEYVGFPVSGLSATAHTSSCVRIIHHCSIPVPASIIILTTDSIVK